jgi:hypothetical protein
MLITYKEVTLDIPKWRQALRRLLDKAKNAIDTICYSSGPGSGFFGLQKPDRVRDDWSNTQRGYSGFKANSKAFLPHKFCLLDAMLHDERLQLASSPDGKSIVLDFYKVQETMAKFEDINRMLNLLVFFLSGQPARGTEAIDCKISNSNRPRCLFLDEQGNIWPVVRRVKWENIAKREVFLPKKCPPELSDLLTKYLLIIRPVETELSRQVYYMDAKAARSAAHNFSTFLWVKNGERVTPDEFTKYITSFLREECGFEGGISAYRHIAVEISRTFFPPNYDDILYDNRARDTARQRGHTAKMAGKGYALEADHLPELSSDVLLNYGRISELWWGVVNAVPGTEPLVPFRVQQERERLRIPELTKEVSELRAELRDANSKIGEMSGEVRDVNSKMDQMTATMAEMLKFVKGLSNKP